MIKTFNEWWSDFVYEKEISKSKFTYNHNGNLHMMEFLTFENLILNAPENEKKGIKKMLVYIDFKNGNVRDYFEHLFKGYIINNY